MRGALFLVPVAVRFRPDTPGTFTVSSHREEPDDEQRERSHGNDGSRSPLSLATEPGLLFALRFRAESAFFSLRRHGRRTVRSAW